MGSAFNASHKFAYMSALPKTYAEKSCSCCQGTGRRWEALPDGDCTLEDCDQCKGTGRAFELMRPLPLEAAEVGVEVPRANIHS